MEHVGLINKLMQLMIQTVSSQKYVLELWNHWLSLYDTSTTKYHTVIYAFIKWT